MTTLKGRTAIVFGGTSGINLGIARAFLEQDANVFVVSRKRENVDAATAELETLGTTTGAGKMMGGATADVRDPDAVEQAVASLVRRIGAIDIVVAGAAGNFLVAADRLSPNGFRTVIDIDLIGTFHVARACRPHLRVPGASIIAISAPQGAKPIMGQAHACSAKAGVNMLVKCLALEWGAEGIRVNAISPGPIADTEGMRRLASDDAAVSAITSQLALRRFGRVDEIAAAACYLAGDASSYVNGIVLDVDGGAMLGTGSIV